MKIKDWHVMHNIKNNYKRYMYGSLTLFDDEDLDGLIEIPYENWSASDFAQILENILEDKNHHWMTDVPRMFNECMLSENIDEEKRNHIMKTFAERLENEKLY